MFEIQHIKQLNNSIFTLPKRLSNFKPLTNDINKQLHMMMMVDASVYMMFDTKAKYLINQKIKLIISHVMQFWLHAWTNVIAFTIF